MLKFFGTQSIEDLIFPLFGHSARHWAALELLQEALKVEEELFEPIHLRIFSQSLFAQALELLHHGFPDDLLGFLDLLDMIIGVNRLK